MATIPELDTALSQRLGPSQFWVRQERIDALLEGVRLWQCYTGFLTSQAPALTEKIYNGTPRQIAWPIRITIAGVQIPRTTLHELDEGFAGWEGEDASAAGPSYWASHGMGGVVTSPPWTTAGDTGFEGPEDLLRGHTAGVDIPVSEGDVQVLLDYAQHYLSFKEGSGELDQTKDAQEGMLDRGGKANARLRRQNFYRAAMQRDRGEEQPGAQLDAEGVDFVRSPGGRR